MKIPKYKMIVILLGSLIFIQVLLIGFGTWFIYFSGQVKVVDVTQADKESGDNNQQGKEITDSSGRKLKLKTSDTKETTEADMSSTNIYKVKYDKYVVCTDDYLKSYMDNIGHAEWATALQKYKEIKEKPNYQYDINCVYALTRYDDNFIQDRKDAFIKNANTTIDLLKSGQTYSSVFENILSPSQLEDRIREAGSGITIDRGIMGK